MTAPATLAPKPLSEAQEAVKKAKAKKAEPVVEDAPSADDPVLNDASGAELLAKKLGGKIIDEYETGK